MGLFKKGKVDLLKKIEFLPATQIRDKWVMYLYPNSEFNSRSVLTVNPGQVAIAVHAGKVEHVFGGDTGTVTLTTDNYPFLKNLVKHVYGGDVPYDMKIYFINATAVNDFKWGTPSAIPIVSTNPMDGNFRYSLMANGVYYVRVRFYQYFLEQIAGSIAPGSILTWEDVQNKVRPQINQAVKSELTNQILTNKYEFGQVVGLIIGTADKLKEALKSKFEFFGLELTDFTVNDVLIPEEDQKRYDELYAQRQKYSSMAGLDQTAMQAGLAAEQMKAVQTAAANEGTVGGMMGAGLGFGYGMTMMNQAKQGMPDAGKASEVKVRCPKCGALNDEKAKFCSECGNKLGGPTCPKCGAELKPGAKFCPECGTKIE